MGRRERTETYFREKLKTERESRGWSQSAMAKMLSDNGIPMHATTIAKIEAGDRAVRIDEAAGIAQLLDESVDVLLGVGSRVDVQEQQRAQKLLRELADVDALWLEAVARDLDAHVELLRLAAENQELWEYVKNQRSRPHDAGGGGPLFVLSDDAGNRLTVDDSPIREALVTLAEAVITTAGAVLGAESGVDNEA